MNTSVPHKIKDLLNSVESLEKPEEKLKETLHFMREAVSSETTPNFRDFWEAKRLCLALFKEKLPSRVRIMLWREYTELSDEVRKLKELLDEQSSFTKEQISLAIDALEGEFSLLEEVMQEPSAFELPKEARALLENQPRYVELQKELDFFNALAGRINGLRKELINTQMRMRLKNHLFERLSTLGRGIFPRRKALTQEISELFSADVARFVQTHLPLGKGPFFDLKEEIKAFQLAAKELNLSTQSFMSGRETLSGLWDQIKEEEKQFREKKAEEKAKITENYSQVLPKAEMLKEKCEKQELSIDQAEEQIELLLKEMRELELGPSEVKHLKRLLFSAKQPLEEKAAEERAIKKQEEELHERRTKEAILALSAHLAEIIDQAEALALDALVEKWEACVKEEKILKPKGIDHAVLENRLGTISDCIQEKRWQELCAMGDEELKSSLHSLLDSRHKERRKLKEALETHRKIVGGSGLNLEESMRYQDLISEEKMRLDTIETLIEEMEEKLFDIEE